MFTTIHKLIRVDEVYRFPGENTRLHNLQRFLNQIDKVYRFLGENTRLYNPQRLQRFFKTCTFIVMCPVTLVCMTSRTSGTFITTKVLGKSTIIISYWVAMGLSDSTIGLTPPLWIGCSFH